MPDVQDSQGQVNEVGEKARAASPKIKPSAQSRSSLDKGVYISTYGCQMNVNDTERMYSLLEMVDYRPVQKPEDASLIIINSCSVREKPVHKVWSEAGWYRDLKAANPDLRVGVAGCVAQQEKEKLLKDVPVLDFVFGPDAIDQLPSIVGRLKTESKVVAARFENEKPYQIETMIRNPGVATFVNIMKGCDNFCTFCVVPFTRGRERSRSLREVLEDVKKLTDRGVREVTLLGQNVNSYKSSCGADFGKLLTALCEDTDLLRVRYTSPHPKDFDQNLIDISQKYRAKIMDYIHLPAQSGNTEVLQRMNRNYTREEYFEKVEMIKAGIPGVVLSTDLIVGFPGETEEQFLDTMTLVEKVGFENIYAFKYSPRPFTKAARYEDQVAEEVKKDRLSRLIASHRDMAFAMAKKYDGQVLEVLIEEVRSEEKVMVGRSTQNKLVYVLAPDQAQSFVGKVCSVKINKAFPTVLRGEVVASV